MQLTASDWHNSFVRWTWTITLDIKRQIIIGTIIFFTCLEIQTGQNDEKRKISMTNKCILQRGHICDSKSWGKATWNIFKWTNIESVVFDYKYLQENVENSPIKQPVSNRNSNTHMIFA